MQCTQRGTRNQMYYLDNIDKSQPHTNPMHTNQYSDGRIGIAAIVDTQTETVYIL